MADSSHKHLINSETVHAKNAIKAAGTQIPFPQRDLHLRKVEDNAGKKLR